MFMWCSMFGILLSNLHLDYIVLFSVKINLAIKLYVSKYCAGVNIAYLKFS